MFLGNYDDNSNACRTILLLKGLHLSDQDLRYFYKMRITGCRDFILSNK
jgi:hypothetical protein